MASSAKNMPPAAMASDCAKGYRLVAPRWADGAFSGEGARKYGGRWNSPGRPVVYLGESRALTALELLVHLTTPLSRSKSYRMIEVHIPTASISDYPASILPEDWRDHPPGKNTMEIGDDWLQAASQLALRVPSTIVPEETNLLLNPQHPDFANIRISPPSVFSFAPRLSITTT